MRRAAARSGAAAAGAGAALVLAGISRKDSAQMHATDAPEAGDRLNGGAWRFAGWGADGMGRVGEACRRTACPSSVALSAGGGVAVCPDGTATAFR